MPAGLGLNNVALRNFVKEFVHKITCGSSLEKTAVINGELFDANSTTFGGAVVQNIIANADAFMPAAIDVGVLGLTTTVDNMPNNTPGTFRVNDTTGIRNGSVVHVIDSAGNFGQALVNHVHRSKSITIQQWLAPVPGVALPPGSIVIASAAGSPSPAMVDTDTSSSAGASAASGQYVAAMLRSMEDLTVSGLGGAPITTINPALVPTIDTFRVGPLLTQNFAVANTMLGNTITFDAATPTLALRGVSRTIVSNDVVETVTVSPPWPVIPAVADTFVLTATQLDGFLNQLMASPGNSGRALVGVPPLPIGAATEGPNDGAPANNSNVAPSAALAYAAAMRFGMLLTNNLAVEPNLMLQDKILSDLRGAEMPSSFPHVPLVTGVGAAIVPTVLTITLPANVGDRATPRSGTFRIQQDITTAGAPNTLIHPALNLGGIPFTRTGNVLTFTAAAWGAALGFAVLPGARVFLMTGAMNGPKKHGYASELASADFLNVLAGVVRNMLDYAIPSI